MKKFLSKFIATFFFINFANAADIYKLDPSHTSVLWSAGHFGFSNPSGKFSNIEGTISIDENDPQKSSVDVMIKMDSLTTGLTKFDEHLKGRDFFDITNFPSAKFSSTSVMSIGKNAVRVAGNLTLLGITKLVTFDAKLNKKGLNPITQRKTVGFSGSGIIKRSDFKMNFGLPGISDNIKLTIEAEGIFDATNSSSATVPQWKIIPETSKIAFEATQNNASITGSFKKFDGTIFFHPYHTLESKVEIEVDTTSVETSFAEAMETLQDSTWLAVKTFPKAIFRANKFIPMNKNSFRSIGTLTIKDKTVPINLDFTLDEFTKTTAKATGMTTIKRSAFGIGNVDVKKANGVENEVVITFTINAEKI
jgi:polyisoprenoid-binding protein YceI